MSQRFKKRGYKQNTRSTAYKQAKVLQEKSYWLKNKNNNQVQIRSTS